MHSPTGHGAAPGSGAARNRWADAPGNVRLTARSTGLPRESVANVSQIVTLGQGDLTERTGRISRARLDVVLAGIDLVLGRA